MYKFLNEVFYVSSIVFFTLFATCLYNGDIMDSLYYLCIGIGFEILSEKFNKED